MCRARSFVVIPGRPWRGPSSWIVVGATIESLVINSWATITSQTPSMASWVGRTSSIINTSSRSWCWFPRWFPSWLSPWRLSGIRSWFPRWFPRWFPCRLPGCMKRTSCGMWRGPTSWIVAFIATIEYIAVLSRATITSQTVACWVNRTSSIIMRSSGPRRWFPCWLPGPWGPSGISGGFVIPAVEMAWQHYSVYNMYNAVARVDIE
mmetsp:Transcript_12732/g.32094  ORF Transcript_12732/g.32094 Transcript_12732/m.32094 type:complete len:207 (-) Transcript_12732:634-1254(-)